MPGPQVFKLDAAVVFRGKEMRVAGRMLLQGASGQSTFRYLLSGGAAPGPAGAGGRRALCAAAAVSVRRTAENYRQHVTVGKERYPPVGVRRLKVRETRAGSGARPRQNYSVGNIRRSVGTPMREMSPGASHQVYSAVKPLATGDLLSAVALPPQKVARPAGASDDDCFNGAGRKRSRNFTSEFPLQKRDRVEDS
jgi:hypothetical protein